VVEVDIDGTLSDTVGIFSLQNVPGCAPYTLAPYRNDNPLNGLTTYDLVLISKHILATEPFNTPYKMIAADANRSGSITSFDIVQMRKLILGIDTAFANNNSWRFVPANHSFINPLNPFQTPFPETLAVQVLTDPIANLNFTAIKIGDVNNTAVPNLTDSAEERIAVEWPVSVEWLSGDWLTGDGLNGDWLTGSNTQANPYAPAGKEFVETIFSIPGIAPINAARGSYDPAPIAVQFTLQFDTDDLIFEKIEPLAPNLSMENFGLNRTEQGLLTFAYSSEDSKPSVEFELFKVIFRKKSDIPLEEALQLTDWPTPAMIYSEDGQAMQPVLDWGGKAAETIIAPNPFGLGGTWVSASTAETLEVFDGSGRWLFSKKISPKEAVKLESGLFPRAGVYFWRMGGETGKLVFAP